MVENEEELIFANIIFMLFILLLIMVMWDVIVETISYVAFNIKSKLRRKLFDEIN